MRKRAGARRRSPVAASGPLNERNIGDALRTVFSSREELHEMFAEWEAAIVQTIHDACARARVQPDPIEHLDAQPRDGEPEPPACGSPDAPLEQDSGNQRRP